MFMLVCDSNEERPTRYSNLINKLSSMILNGAPTRRRVRACERPQLQRTPLRPIEIPRVNASRSSTTRSSLFVRIITLKRRSSRTAAYWYRLGSTDPNGSYVYPGGVRLKMYRRDDDGLGWVDGTQTSLTIISSTDGTVMSSGRIP